MSQRIKREGRDSDKGTRRWGDKGKREFPISNFQFLKLRHPTFDIRTEAELTEGKSGFRHPESIEEDLTRLKKTC
jgi:hypothetical protein